MTGDSSDDPSVLIVGGGIAGLSLAGFLRRGGVQPTVVEQASEWDRVGWGIGLWGNGIRVLSALSAADSAVDLGTTPDVFAVRAAGGERLAEVDIPGERTFLAIHRADLHAALRAAAPDDRVRMGTTPESIERTGDGVRAVFSDGSRERYDTVVGADGVHSAVRGECFDDRRWTLEDQGTAVWSFWLPPDADVDPPRATTSVWGAGAEAFVGDVGGRGLVNLATRMALEETPEPPALDHLTAVAGELGWRLPTFVDAIDEDTHVFFDRNRSVEAERWHAGRVAIVGDAAHAVHPISGMGAALALEDAYVLADELTSRKAVEPALADFEERRRDRVERVQRAARFEAGVTFTESEVVARLRNGLVRWMPVMEWFLERQIASVSGTTLSDL